MGRGLLAPFLLLSMGSTANGEETMGPFMRDVINAFQLKSPTIVYDSNRKAPEICSDQWILCLPSENYAVNCDCPSKGDTKSNTSATRQESHLREEEFRAVLNNIFKTQGKSYLNTTILEFIYDSMLLELLGTRYIAGKYQFLSYSK